MDLLAVEQSRVQEALVELRQIRGADACLLRGVLSEG